MTSHAKLNKRASAPNLYDADTSRDPVELSSFIIALSGLLSEQRSVRTEILIATCAVVLSTWLRFAVDELLPVGFPFLTFFPAVLLTALFASIRAAVVVALLTGGIAWGLFIPPIGAFGISLPTVIAMVFFFVITSTEIFFIALSGMALKRIKAERDRSKFLAKSRDLMFSELQHRVSNNLANVAALLKLQANATDSAQTRKTLTASVARVQTVARIQRNLYLPNEQEVEVMAFLEQLAQDTQEAMSLGQDVSVTVTSDRFRIHRDQAVPFGLVVSELIMNAMEHSQTVDDSLKIRILCTRSTDQSTGQSKILLSVIDNGQGVSEEFDKTPSDSLWMRIARGFAEGLGGQLTLGNKPDGVGAIATLEFPEPSAD
ncbi:MAG: sensor histidine kinase [Rhodobacterales bacterium]